MVSGLPSKIGTIPDLANANSGGRGESCTMGTAIIRLPGHSSLHTRRVTGAHTARCRVGRVIESHTVDICLFSPTGRAGATGTI